MKKQLLFVTVSAFLSTLGSANAAPANMETQVTKPIYAWKTENDTNAQTGKFNHCLIKNMYDNGTLVMVAENGEGVKRLALSFPQSKMEPGQRIDLTLQIDRHDVFPVEAVAVTPQILTIAIPETLPAQMRKGEALYLRGPNDEVVYTLTGIEGAVDSLRDCIALQHKNDRGSDIQTAEAENIDTSAITATPESTQENPAMADETTPMAEAAPQQSTDKPEKLSEKVGVGIAGIFGSIKEISGKILGSRSAESQSTSGNNLVQQPAPAEMSVTTAENPEPVSKPVDDKPVAETTPETAVPMAIVADEPLPPTETVTKKASATSPMPTHIKNVFTKAGMAPGKLLQDQGTTLDYSWKRDNLILGAREISPAGNKDFGANVVDYVSQLKASCKGPFIAESSAVTENNGQSWQIVETACSSPQDRDTITALFFATIDGHTDVFSVTADADQGADAVKARDTIAKALTR